MLTGPLFMLQVYDRVLASRSEETLVALTLLVGFLYAMFACLDFARGRLMARVGARLQIALDHPLFLSELETATLSPGKSGHPTLRDVDTVRSVFASPVFLALFDLPWTPIFLAAIFIFHPWLGWFATAAACFLICLAVVNQIVTAKRTKQAHQLSESAHALSREAVGGADVVRSQAMVANVSARLDRARNDALNKAVRASDWTGSFTSMTKAARLFLQSAMLAIGAWLVLHDEMTAGAMIAGSIILGRALAPVEQILGGWQSLQQARGAWKRIAIAMASQKEAPNKTTLPSPQAHLQAHKVTVVPPGARLPTLRDIGFDLQPGEALGVIGRSGSGKSTLARALLGIWPVAYGELRLDGATVDQFSSEDLGQHIGYLPQDAILFSGTITQNIARMSMTPDSEKVVEAAQKANAHEMIMQLSEGYDTLVTNTMGRLSGGQRQRIALARAFYGDPVIVILDEPNSALDADGSAALNRAIASLKAENKSAIVMTHRPTAIAECDKILILESGTSADYGVKDDVLRRSVQNASQLPQKPKVAAGQ